VFSPVGARRCLALAPVASGNSESRRCSAGTGEAPPRPYNASLDLECNDVATREKRHQEPFFLRPAPADESHFRLGNRRFHPFNVYTEKPRREKLNCLYNNPVKRGWAKEPGDWPWSSWRFYFLRDASLLAMDRVQ